jgi:hypothetical protein
VKRSFLFIFILIAWPLLIFPYNYPYLSRRERIKKTLDSLERKSYPKKRRYFLDFKEELRRTLDFWEGKFYLSLNWYRYHLGYKEFDDSENVLDEDFGWMKGWYIKFGYRSYKSLGEFWGSPFLEAYFRRFDNQITYKGRASNGVTIDIEIDQKSKIYRFGAKFGTYKNLSGNLILYGYGDIGKRVWFRGENQVLNISGTLVQDYKEKYWWVYFGGGAGIEYQGEDICLGLDFELMGAPEGLRKMHAQLGSGGTFNLGSVWGYELELPIKYYIVENLSLDLTPYYIYWNIDESDTQIIDGTAYYEPHSRSKIYGYLVGFTMTF